MSARTRIYDDGTHFRNRFGVTNLAIQSLHKKRLVAAYSEANDNLMPLTRSILFASSFERSDGWMEDDIPITYQPHTHHIHITDVRKTATHHSSSRICVRKTCQRS
eukprot:GHVU01228172.1.p2 GENE.GHVU01228172.1~~GHVU01228172.1.p2  ORF type:complete len:106 (-),score=1.28 GHVU01228172.1:264-581(-)